MHKHLLLMIFVYFFSFDVFAGSLNLDFDHNYAYQVSNPMAMASPLVESGTAAGSGFEIDTNKSDKSILPVVLSASFLMMSLYGDNPDSSMYRAVGAAATVISLSWYLE